jgi:hypothetical protein
MIVQLVSLNSILDNSICYFKVPVGKHWVLGVFLSVFEKEEKGCLLLYPIWDCKYVSGSTNLFKGLQMLSKDLS